MPKKNSGVNKSQLVRDILSQAPKTPVKEIFATLEAQGIKGSNNHVYLIKSKMGMKRRQIKRAKAVAAGTDAGIVDPVELVRDVKKLADRAGGMKHLKELVEILAEW